jgi:hypothetical protein
MTPEEARTAAIDGGAWAQFCDTLKEAGEKIVAHSTDELDRIEGFRSLARLARGGLESFLEHGDTEFSTGRASTTASCPSR